ncbi:hypothetical protein [Thermococcus sp.]|uniref:hypothetical protein n=1 Tax=Thermococcus sp. TaxID=35749 RepID=UPI0025FF147A|nr:hypothetical protein [Thermococcus sp.]
MPCIQPASPDKVKNMKEESFIKEGKGKLRVTIEGSETLETTVNGRLKSVEEIAEMLGVEPKGERIEAVVDGVKVRMEKGKLELEFESGDRMRIERA